LVAEARLGWSNEKGSSSPTIPGMGLHEVMGSRETDVQTGQAGRTVLRWTGSDLPGFAPGETLQARWYEETLAPLGPQAHVVGTFPNGNAAAVISSYGQGKTLMLGSYVGAAYETRREASTVRFYNALLDWAGVERPVSTTGAEPEVRYLESGRDTLLFVFNHGKQPIEPAISLRLRGKRYQAVDLVTARPVDVSAQDGLVKLRAPIAAEDVWVVKLSPQD
jgi:beta-galactosidase